MMLGNLFDENDGNALNASQVCNVHTFAGSAPPPGRLPCGLCGLENQGATCYLNSLLQTLLYTPEFRDALFKIEEEELNKKGGRIPLQLRHLFASLLLADQQAASTTELTNSFGWNNREELQQHDVQELNRILFSAIETSLIGTSGSNLISKLYRGTIVNQICCQECGHVSSREEDFLDLNIIVSGFNDLQSSLNASYQQQEVMKGKNQYYCTRCIHLVDAKKGMKIRKLPPILTFSLLRFNFDFVKGERFKESGRFAFPISIDMSPYCEKVSEESEVMYELFSVVIHSGGSNRGHYHVYIRDIDDLGEWIVPENEKSSGGDNPTPPNLSKNSFVKSLENPVNIIQSILQQQKGKYLSLDLLCSALVNLTGMSWNKQFKRSYGPINKFLLKHDDVFVFNQSTNIIHLKESKSPPPSVPIVNGNLTNGAIPNGTSTPPNEDKVLNSCLSINGNCSHKNSDSHKACANHGNNWFDFNDTRVTPIRAKQIETQFGGKESAYMLFYRRSSLLRPIDAHKNPSFNMPPKLRDLIAKENDHLHKLRKEHEEKLHSVNIKVHFGPSYRFENGCLEPVPNALSFIDLTIDRRKTVEELEQKIKDAALELCQSESFVINFARELPAGLHIYDEISQDKYSETLEKIGILEGTRLFVWNGKQVGGETVPIGASHEPILLSVVCKLPPETPQELPPRGFSKNLTLAELKALICSLTTIDLNECIISRVQIHECDSSYVPLKTHQDNMTLEELGLIDGDCLYFESKLSSQVRSTSPTSLPISVCKPEGKKIKVTVQNRCGVFGDLTAFECPQTEIEADTDTLVNDLIGEAVVQLQVNCEEAHKLRRVTESPLKKAPYYYDVTLKEAGIEDGTFISLVEGIAPKSSEVTLMFSIGTSVGTHADFEITLDKSTSIAECLKQMLALANLEGDSWHLRKTNWCGEPAKVLPSDENSTLEAENVQHGDVLLILEGRQPPKGYLCLPVFLAHSPSLYIEDDYTAERHYVLTEAAEGIIRSALAIGKGNGDGNYVRIGEIEVTSETTLAELKNLILTLPFLSSLPIPSIRHLRLRLLDCGRLGRVLKGVTNSLKKLKLVTLTSIYLQLLPIEEDMCMNDILLCVSRSVCQSSFRYYSPPIEVVWNGGKGAHSGSLKKFLSERFSIAMDKICIAKHFPERCEWKVIEFPNVHKQSNNRKRHDSKMKLRASPYFLRDGDTIGIKDYASDPDPDFSTPEDEEGRKILDSLREEKRQQRTNKWNNRNSGDLLLGGGNEQGSQEGRRIRTPEVGISIRVEGVSSEQDT